MGHLVRGAACSCDRARAPSGAPPRRFFTRSPFFLIGPEGFTAPFPGSIGAAFHPIVSSHQRRPPHRERAVNAPPGTGGRLPPAGAAIPAPPTERLRKTPSVNGDGVHHMQNGQGVKSGPPLCKVYQQWLAVNLLHAK